MKAVMFERHGGLEVLQYRDDLPIPRISPNEVLIRVRAAAMNYNDVWARTGVPGLELPLPHISGTDCSGVIEDVGSEVRNLNVGDEVVVNGSFSCGQCEHCNRGLPQLCPDFRIWGFQTGPNDGAEAEYAKVPARNVLPKPKNLGWEGVAAVGGVLVTVWRALVVTANMKAGDWVLIWGGSGGLGSTAIQLCKAFGARSIAITSSVDRCAMAADLGADYVLNRNKDRLSLEVMRITRKRGVDIVFEHPGADTWLTSTYCLKWGGTIVTVGATTGYKATMDIRHLWNKMQRYLGSHYGTTAEMLDAMRFAESGQVKPIIMEVLPLKDVARGHEIIERGETMGKIVIVPD